MHHPDGPHADPGARPTGTSGVARRPRRARKAIRVGAALAALALVTVGLVVAGGASPAADHARLVRGERDDGDRGGDTPAPEADDAPVAGASGVGDPYYPDAGNGGYDVSHYDLALTWRPGAQRMEGVATITAAATESLASFVLDAVGFDLDHVSVDGEPATTSLGGERDLTVTPATPIGAGEEFTVEVVYRVAPQTVDGADPIDPGWVADGEEVYAAFEPNGAATLFPANDHPSDKATYRLAVTVPDGLDVVANGLLDETMPGDGVTTWVFDAPDPMASYLVQLVVADLVMVETTGPDGLPIRHAFDADVADELGGSMDRTAEMVDVYDDVFGPYPFVAYGAVVVDEPLGFALETQTLSIFGSDAATSERVVAHELAHSWFGDHVSPASWRDIWLNEGFAVYAELLWAEHTGAGGPDEFADAMRNAAAVFDLPPADPGAASLFAPSVYQRGALTLHVLRHAVGDDSFFRILRTWVERFGGGSASTGDFEALAEDVSGDDLTPLFDAWLRAPQMPDVGEWLD
jgi:aminopeptidase N